mgnify:FL=1
MKKHEHDELYAHVWVTYDDPLGDNSLRFVMEYALNESRGLKAGILFHL